MAENEMESGSRVVRDQ